MNERGTILVSGWRMLPHSYAVVNQFQCLEMLRRPRLRLYFEDLRYFAPQWKATRGLFAPAAEQAILGIPPLPPGFRPDAELRIVYPYDLLRPPRGRRTFVFGTAEYRIVPPHYVSGSTALERAMQLHPDIVIITPSNWSRQGFLASGADPDRVVVIPHGVDPDLFHTPAPEQRATARARLALADDEFVFFSAGAMTLNKNLKMLLLAFATLLRDCPRARLLLKGLDALYPSQAMAAEILEHTLPPEQRTAVLARIIYVGQSLSFTDLASLYHAADCYVSPYVAEGFNMPVLEAAASGLPVICTAGGSTDDFTDNQFCRRIRSGETVDNSFSEIAGTRLTPSLEHLQELMLGMVADRAFIAQARAAGPAFVAEGFTWKRVVDRLVETLLGD